MDVELDNKIDNFCKIILNQKMAKYDRIINQFSKFKNENSLQEILDRKADVKDFNEIVNAKVSRDDWSSLITNLKQMYDKLQHVSVI
jgi:hypothetical protein